MKYSIQNSYLSPRDSYRTQTPFCALAQYGIVCGDITNHNHIAPYMARNMDRKRAYMKKWRAENKWRLRIYNREWMRKARAKQKGVDNPALTKDS